MSPDHQRVLLLSPPRCAAGQQLLGPLLPVPEPPDTPLPPRLACFRGSVPQVQWGECTVHFRVLKQMYGIVHIIIAQGAIWIVCLAYAVQVLL